ncbi:MAG: hypothetical protein AB2L24_26410 [Mangrovibacterium sp.]
MAKILLSGTTGKELERLTVQSHFAPNFSIACDESGKAAFHGEIYEVRYSTFDSGKFDAGSDFLLDYKQIKEFRAKKNGRTEGFGTIDRKSRIRKRNCRIIP